MYLIHKEHKQPTLGDHVAGGWGHLSAFSPLFLFFFPLSMFPSAQSDILKAVNTQAEKKMLIKYFNNN